MGPLLFDYSFHFDFLFFFGLGFADLLDKDLVFINVFGSGILKLVFGISTVFSRL